jgi:hypothetical protein
MAYSKKVEKNRGAYIFGCILFLCAIVYLGFNIIDGWYKYQEGSRRLQASTQSYLELNEQYEDLKKKKAMEESSTGYEMHVRSKFDLHKQDEKVVFIISEETPQPIEEEGGIKKIMKTFKNFFN